MASSRSEGSTIKRRKEKENSNKDGSQKSDKKKLLKYDWQQNDSEVIVTFHLGSRVDNNSITQKFSDHNCFIQLEDGRTWQCDLFQPVVEEGTHTHIKGNRLILKMIKKIPNVHWSQLEYKKGLDENQIMEVDSPRMKKPVEILNVKADSFEQDEHVYTLYLCVKNIKKETLKVHFKESYFTVMFQTSDQNVLKLHPASTPDTFFLWKQTTKEAIKPEDCKYTLTSTRLEINLKKNVPKFWEANAASNVGLMIGSSQTSAQNKREVEDSTQKSEEMCVENFYSSPSTVTAVLQDIHVLVLHLFVKNIQKDTLKVHFKENYFTVTFQTSDQNILKLYPGSTPDTFFMWKETTKEAIKPEDCKYTLTSTHLEINLKKSVPKFWNTNECVSSVGTMIGSSQTSNQLKREIEDSTPKTEEELENFYPNTKMDHKDTSAEHSYLINSTAIDENKDVAVVDISHIKNNWFERSPESFTLQVYVKNIRKETLKIQFKENYFVVIFQTGDPKFCALHPSALPNSFFSWKANLKESIKPEECTYKLSSTCLEITLKKNTPKYWNGFEAVRPAAEHIPSNTWIPVTRTSTTSSMTHSPASSLKDKDNDLNVMGLSSHLTSENNKEEELRGNNMKAVLTEQTQSDQIGTDNRKDLISKKPTCMVSPLNKGKQHEQIVTPGLTGLDNLGNTCFMNSVLQCLANTREFRDYFFEGFYQREINKDNPLGMGGNMAVAFAVLLRVLWSGTHRSYAPSKLKMLTSMKAPQFSGFAQHDAQEFMAFFLDGLHEDLNRIIDKPYTQSIDSDGRPDEIVAEESWKLYKQRNDSIVVDLFQGQYKSKLVCPVCSKVSITFDPFLYLSVPLPKKQHILPIYFFSKDPYRKPVKYLIKIPVEATVEELKEKIFILTKVRPNNLRVFEVYNGKIHKFFKKDASLSEVSPNDTIFVFEVLDSQLAGGKVLELAIIQRVIMPKPVTKCSFCKRDCTPGEKKLRRCTKCFRVGYCDQNCQKNHWQTHKNQCKLIPEPVGCPFVISLPESQATFSKLCRIMEAFSRYSVDVFQPPVQLGDVHCRSNSICSSSSSVSSMADVADMQSVDCALGASEITSSVSFSESALSLENGCGENVNAKTVLCNPDICNPKFEEHDFVTATSLTPGGTLFSEDKCLGDSSMSLQNMKNNAEEPFGRGCGECSNMTEKEHDIGTDISEPGPSSEQYCRTLSNAEDASHTVFPSSSSHKPAVNLVFGQLQNEPVERSPPLFHIRRVTENGQPISGVDKEYIEDKGDKALDLYNCYYLAMEWKNNEKMKNYVLVQSKELEYECNDREEELLKHASNEISLRQCLQVFTEPEVLNKQEAWYCPRCKEHREATKQLSLWRVPTVLIIQLKRFSFKNLIWRDKIDKMVDFPVRGLDLSQFFCGPLDPPGVTPVYDLFAVINHHGSILGGHYTAFARCVDLQNTRRSEVDWRLFDDSRVSFVPETSVVTKAAYMLFYRRRGVPFTLPHGIPGTNAPVEQNRHRNDFDTELVVTDDGTDNAIIDSNILTYEGEDDDGLNTPPSLTDMDSVD